MTDLWVDFNSVDEAGRTTSLVQFARQGADLSEGSSILVGDSEGNTCRAEVCSIDSSGLVVVALQGESMKTCQPAVATRA